MRNKINLFLLNLSICTLMAVSVAGSTNIETAAAQTKNYSDKVITRSYSQNGGVLNYKDTDSNGNEYIIDNSSNDSNDTSNAKEEVTSSASENLKTSSSLPKTYDLRNYGYITSIKDQGVTGCCWAFAAIKSIESNCIKLGLVSASSADYSENHMAWFAYSMSSDQTDPLYGDGMTVVSDSSSSNSPFPFMAQTVTGAAVTANSNTVAYSKGGSAIISMFELAKWCGVESESAAPFTADTTSQMNDMADSMAATGSSLRYDSYAHLKNANCYDFSTDSEMKKAIMKNGAMDIAIYYDSRYLNSTTNGTAYYQTYYSSSTATEKANHCVTIVGWDDNYSKTNFYNQPSSDGAWLIANSYGSAYGDSGYFWLSYDEASICDKYIFQMESTSNYDNIYQYDGYGWGDYLKTTKAVIKEANVFTADTDSAQELDAVSFYTISDSQPYTIQVYRNVKGNKPTSGTLIKNCTTKGVAKFNGYHTVSLAMSVNIKAGEKFAVVVSYNHKKKKAAYAPIEGAGVSSVGTTISYSSQAKQSYVFYKGTWYDNSSLGYNNVCVKAFSKNASTAESVSKTASAKYTLTSSALSVSKKNITLKVGKSYSPIVEISGLDDSDLSFSSSSKSVAKVSSIGKITALKKGRAVITIKSSAGNKITMNVTVKKIKKK